MTTPRHLWHSLVPMDPEQATEALEALQAAYDGRWHIWRSQLTGGEPWWWYASIRTPSAGIHPTVSGPGPDELRAVLEQQRHLAMERDYPPL